ncbi:MAG: hypothetical protein EOM55_03045 [Clostridia bacterium]|nr:hypothetical protein [Clostridia bacterium]
MKKKVDVKVKRFNLSGYVEDDAVKEGTILDQDYGKGLFLEDAVEALAYALIMAHKDVLMSESNKPNFNVTMILQKIDDLVDFPEEYSREDFLKDVKKTFAQKEFNPADFMKILEENICTENEKRYNYKMIKKAFFKKIEKVLKIDKNTKKESVLLQCLSIEPPPHGYLKTEFIGCAINFIDELSTIFVESNPQFFEQTDFSKENWFEDFILKQKISMLKRDKNSVQDYEKVDAFYQMKAQFNSFEDLFDILQKDEKYIQDSVLGVNSFTQKSSQKNEQKRENDYKQLY